MQDRLDDLVNDMESEDQSSTSTPDTSNSTVESSPDQTVSNQESSSVETSTESNPTEVPDQTPPSNSNDNSPRQDGDEKQSKDKPKPKYSHEEQVAYSFSKLNSKLSQTKRELKEALAQIEALKKAKPQETPKTYGPDDFESQADYFKYIANQQLIEQLKKASEAKQASDAKAMEQQAAQDRYSNLAQSIYNTPEAINEYNTVVGKAIEEDGLDQVLNSDAVLADFLNSSNMAPRLVYHFAAMPEELDRIMSIKDPTDKRFALNILSHKLASIFAAKPAENKEATKPSQSSQANVPIVGKAGTGGASAGSIPEQSMDEVLAELRSMV